MKVVKCRLAKLLVAVYKNNLIHVHVFTDMQSNCDKYIRFIVYGDKDFETTFKFNDAPGYIQYIFNHINRNNKISLTSQYYLLQGPCCNNKDSNVYRLAQMHINDYNRMLLQEHEFMYDHNISKVLAEQSLRPIYDAITGKYPHPNASYHSYNHPNASPNHHHPNASSNHHPNSSNQHPNASYHSSQYYPSVNISDNDSKSVNIPSNNQTIASYRASDNASFNRQNVVNTPSNNQTNASNKSNKKQDHSIRK